MVAPRDYYADLELPPTAEITDVKKSYRKLALKYHPDRNPGREAEVNAQFLIIQTAHDVLTDPQRKAKFDAERGRGPAGRASGVRGNPWADVGSQFPTPPRRNQPGRNAASGADRWNTRFSSGVPPTARQQTSASSETRRNAAKAFENMRAKPQAKPTGGQKASAPPPTPPRTEGARQRQQASFGNPHRKSGYQPHASAFGDEPPVTNKNYSARRPVPPQPQPQAESQASEEPKHHQVPSTGARVPDPLSQFRDQGDDRQRSPYASKTTEKTNPFDASMGQAAQQNGPPKPEKAEDTSAHGEPSRKPSIFDLTDDAGTAKASPGEKNFARSSVDDINTSFVNDDGRTAWQFSAGATTPTEAAAHADDQHDPHAPPPRPPRPDIQEDSKKTHDGAFHPDAWNDGFGSQTFAPPPRTNSSGSPSKTSRTNSRKAKPPKSGSGEAQNAPIVISEDEEEVFTWTGRNGQARPTKSAMATDSPQAMDIDSPPASATDSPGLNGARNIHVEPSRPEWRSGDVSGTKSADEKPTRPAKLPVGGSEDTEEFQASFADVKKVAPFADEGGGLGSFSNMKDELPFESKASAQIPIQKEFGSQARPQPLVLPDPPNAPRPPPTIGVPNIKTNEATWQKYVQDFQKYVQDWDGFTGQVTDHFGARKAHIQMARKAQGYGFLVSGNAECAEYFNSVQQDNDVRRRWNAACEEHEQRLREFMACRDKMAGGSI